MNINKPIFTILLSILSISILSLVSCGDKEDISCENNIVMGNYFPAYPNSYWIYNTNNGDTIKYTIRNGYEKFEGNCATYFTKAQCFVIDNQMGFSFGAGQGTLAIVYSPIYPKTIGIPQYAGISFIDFSKSKVMNSKPITLYRESIGNKTISLDSSNNYENTLVVKEFDTLKPEYFYLDYFAKNIGLVMRDSISKDSIGMDTTRILWLIDYKILK